MTRLVLVTGASGFIGKRLIGALARDGFKVRAAARDPSSIIATSDVERVALPDLSRPADWSALLAGVSHVVHLAGLAHAPGRIADEVYARVNAEAAGELAEASRGKVERFVFMSSVRAQAGHSADHALTEMDPPHPFGAYGRTKLEAERLVAQSGTCFTVLRPAVVYGPGVKGNIASLVTVAKSAMPLPFAGLDNRRSLLGLDNLLSAVSFVLNNIQAANETYLVADAEPITVADLVAAMREGLGRPPHLMSVPQGAVRRILKTFGREEDWERITGQFVISPAKLMAIGWRAPISTHDGVIRMMRAENGAMSA
jgi:UDP-glucose 4-epimerase